jgi:hypothetical protein
MSADFDRKSARTFDKVQLILITLAMVFHTEGMIYIELSHVNSCLTFYVILLPYNINSSVARLIKLVLFLDPLCYDCG